MNGAPLHTLVHAEAGHFALPHDWQRDPFRGVCPYHGDCMEGLASGFSMSKRWEQSPESLSISHPAWDLEPNYIGLVLFNLIYAYSPMRIILGGGVSRHPGLPAAVGCKVKQLRHGYVQSPLLADRIDEYIFPPFLGNRPGGAIAMARNCAGKK